MAQITVNTNGPKYKKSLSELEVLKKTLSETINVIKILQNRGEHDKAKRIFQRDPLLRNTVQMARKLADFFELES